MVRGVNGRPVQLLLLFVAAALISGCAAPRATWNRSPARAAPPPAPESSEPAAPPASKSSTTHVVEKGQNLYRIGLLYGVTADEIAGANGIDDPTQLEVGQRLQIPAQTQVAAAPGGAASRPQVRSSVSRREPARGNREGATLRWPVQGVLYSRFGPRGATRHDGIDIAAPAGTRIVAAADGVVIYSGSQRGYGNLVIVRHSGDLITLYAHNQRNLVEEGAEVKAGQPVAIVGSTGRATGPHCHFEVRRGTEPHDPMNFLP